MTTISAPDNVISVTQLNRRIRLAVEGSCSGIWIEAEVSSAKRHVSGHLYFVLCDAGSTDGKAQVNGVMWRSTAARYGKWIESGSRVLLLGSATIYEVGGKYQFVVERAVASGEGERARQLTLLRERLQKEGLFDPDRRRPIPQWPGCVGIVTSRQGAALQDIVKVAGRRFPVRLLLCHAAVQGPDAPGDIVAAIRQLEMQESVDVLIVGRGGGSAEDLDAFNDERVVRAIAACQKPVISAVGHEVDVSLSDLAADRRAATPSEAAELAVPDAEEVRRRLAEYRKRLRVGMKTQVGDRRALFAARYHRLVILDPRSRIRDQMTRFEACQVFLRRWPKTLFEQQKREIAQRQERFRFWSKTALTGQKGALSTVERDLGDWPIMTMERARGELIRYVTKLNALSPLSCLSRGYAVVTTPSGEVLKRVDQVCVGDDLHVRLASGDLSARVTEIRQSNKQEHS